MKTEEQIRVKQQVAKARFDETSDSVIVLVEGARIALLDWILGD